MIASDVKATRLALLGSLAPMQSPTRHDAAPPTPMYGHHSSKYNVNAIDVAASCSVPSDADNIVSSSILTVTHANTHNLKQHPGR